MLTWYPDMHLQAEPAFGARLVLVASKMHELVRTVDTSLPAAISKPESSLLAYNHSKLAQVNCTSLSSWESNVSCQAAKKACYSCVQCIPWVSRQLACIHGCSS